MAAFTCSIPIAAVAAAKLSCPAFPAVYLEMQMLLSTVPFPCGAGTRTHTRTYSPTVSTHVVRGSSANDGSVLSTFEPFVCASARVPLHNTSGNGASHGDSADEQGQEKDSAPDPPMTILTCCTWHNICCTCCNIGAASLRPCCTRCNILKITRDCLHGDSSR